MEVLLFCLGIILGLVMGFLLQKLWARSRDYSGTIVVSRLEGKTLYSLVLEDYPEKLEFKKHVIFKVEAPDVEDRS